MLTKEGSHSVGKFNIKVGGMYRVVESLHCTTKTNLTLNVSYTRIKIKNLMEKKSRWMPSKNYVRLLVKRLK